MSLILMIIGTVAWLWKAKIELALILCVWAIWIEAVSTNFKLELRSEQKNDTKDL